MRNPDMAERLAKLRAALVDGGLDGVVIPRFDAYQGEVVAPHDERLGFVTGFTGSAGIAYVGMERAVIFVDGRYQVQVRAEVAMPPFELSHFFDAPIEAWLRDNVRAGQRIGVNPLLVPGALYDKLAAAVEGAGGTLVPLDSDLVDAIWADQPPPPLGPITAFPVLHAGEESLAKRQRLGAALEAAGADLLIETQPDNIAWLLNVRGADIAYTPVPHSTAILHADGAVDWFVDARKLPNDRSTILAEGLAIRAPEEFLDAVAMAASGRKVLVDPAFAPVAVRLAVTGAKGQVVSQFSPVTLAKAVKNPVELSGFRTAHVSDGIAWAEFLAWLDEEVPRRLAAGIPITEIEAQDTLGAFRRFGAEAGFAEDSFGVISASGSNAAMCHYSSKPATSAPITDRLPYLIDSGGQYFGGTTDATRTMMYGPVPEAVRRTYTAVLKGFVALMSAQFPKGTCGHHLDALARRPLWDLGLDYDHGTGHGVGHFLSVHEHPHRLGKVVNQHQLEAGVIMTVEPGYYVEGEYGLRVENQVEVVAGAPGYLRFETLTLVPIDLDMADRAALTPAETSWLDAYHARVAAALTGRLSPRAEAWLARMTPPRA